MLLAIVNTWGRGQWIMTQFLKWFLAIFSRAKCIRLFSLTSHEFILDNLKFYFFLKRKERLLWSLKVRAHNHNLIKQVLSVKVPVGIYLFKFNKRNTRKRCEICSKLIIKTPERRHWRRSSVFIVNFEHISHPVLVFLLLTLSR